MTTILVIPDAHVKPGISLDRFDWLGKLILDRQPDHIVCIGDFADMESLCSYDRGKKSFEGRNYKKDIQCVVEAQKKLFAPITEWNKNKAKNGKKQYRPYRYLTLGNHEQRIDRAIEIQPELEGTISINDLKYNEYWDVFPYLEPVIIKGIAFSHFFVSGVMGKAIGGEHPAHSLITKMFQSCIMGHVHTRDMSERTNAEGKRITSLVVGCFLDEDQYEKYAGEANKMWWKGVVMLHDVQNGEYEPEWISLRQLKRLFNGG